MPSKKIRNRISETAERYEFKRIDTTKGVDPGWDWVVMCHPGFGREDDNASMQKASFFLALLISGNFLNVQIVV